MGVGHHDHAGWDISVETPFVVTRRHGYILMRRLGGGSRCTMLEAYSVMNDL
jgi:hypothetical protein